MSSSDDPFFLSFRAARKCWTWRLARKNFDLFIVLKEASNSAFSRYFEATTASTEERLYLDYSYELLRGSVEWEEKNFSIPFFLWQQKFESFETLSCFKNMNMNFAMFQARPNWRTRTLKFLKILLISNCNLFSHHNLITFFTVKFSISLRRLHIYSLDTLQTRLYHPIVIRLQNLNFFSIFPYFLSPCCCSSLRWM